MNFEGLNRLVRWTGEEGYISSAPKESQGNFLARGSEAAMLTGTGKIQNCKGSTQRASVKGGFAMHTIEETYASVGAAADTTGYGNVNKVWAALFYIGKGLVRFAGASLAVTASATLSLLIRRSGSYTGAAECGPWQAGLAAPSAPIIRAITPPAGFEGKVTGTVSVVIWRIRSTTSAESNQSPVSNIVAASGQSIAVTLPLKDANGQDAWGIGVTKSIEGRVGAHFAYAEVTEAEVTEAINRSNVATNAASLNITSVTAGFTSEHIGWTVVLSGGAPACALTTYVTDVPAADTLTLAAMPPTTSTGVTMVLTRGVEGTARTTVIEWRDGDLVGTEFAPKRNFPPPSGLFGGDLEDLYFVDGAYADSVTTTSASNRGTGIAPSEPGQPEAYAPDTPIFTPATPTALVRGPGMYYRFSRNRTYTIQYLGGPKPLSVEPLWENIGILYQHQAVVGDGGRVYLWPSDLGLLRMGDDGLPEGDFATAVKDDLIACTDAAKRVLGWDGKQIVVACYEKTVWPFFTSLGKWGAPATFSAMANIKAAITENNQLLLVDVNDDIWEYNVGSGMTMKVRTPWIASAGALDTVAAASVSLRADNAVQNVTTEVFADGDETTAVSTLTQVPSRTGFQRLPTSWPNVIDCDYHQIQVTTISTTSSGDHGIESIETFGPSTGTTK
jgi:hypothetical protein